MYSFNDFLNVQQSGDPQVDLNAHKRKTTVVGEDAKHLEVHKAYQHLKAQPGAKHHEVEAQLVAKFGDHAKQYFAPGYQSRKNIKDDVSVNVKDSLQEAGLHRHELRSNEANRASREAHVASGGAGISLASHHNQAVSAHERAETAHNNAAAEHYRQSQTAGISAEVKQKHEYAVSYHQAQSSAHRATLNQVHQYDRVLGKGHPSSLQPKNESVVEPQNESLSVKADKLTATGGKHTAASNAHYAAFEHHSRQVKDLANHPGSSWSDDHVQRIRDHADRAHHHIKMMNHHEDQLALKPFEKKIGNHGPVAKLSGYDHDVQHEQTELLQDAQEGIEPSGNVMQTYREETLNEARAFQSLTDKAYAHSNIAAEHDSQKHDKETRGKAHEAAANAHRSAHYAHADKVRSLSSQYLGKWSKEHVDALHHHVDRAADHHHMLLHHDGLIYPFGE